MKKKIISIFMLCFLVSSIPSFVQAQVVIDSVVVLDKFFFNPKYWPPSTPKDTIDKYDNFSLTSWTEGEEYTFRIFFKPTNTDDIVHFRFVPEVYDVSARLPNTAVRTTLPDSIRIPNKEATTLDVTFKVVHIDDNVYQYSVNVECIYMGYANDYIQYRDASDALTLFWMTAKKPNYTLNYRQPTVNYEGELEIKGSGGTDVLRSLDGGVTWKGVKRPFTKREKNELSPGDVIWLKDLANRYVGSLMVGRDEQKPGIVRTVMIPKIDQATINVGTGLQYVSSGSDYCFAVTPNDSQSGKDLVVTTNRTTIPDSQGVKVTKTEGGRYNVCIYRVQSEVELSFNFVGVTSKENIANSKLWAENGQLYISALDAGTAQVYNITGSLVKTIRCNAGEIQSVPLATGIYMVLINGKTSKVVVR